MKVVVAVKQVLVLGDELELTPDEQRVDPDYVDRALNEWDACALEEALRLRERLGRGEVIAATVGPDEAESALRRCLAMGADRAARVDANPLDPFSVAHALAPVVRAEAPDLVFCGVQSGDSVQGSTGGALAGLLDLPCVAVVKQVRCDDAALATVHRELEGGLVDVVAVDLPAVLTIQTGINEPRYATLRAIKQAERLEIAVVAPPADAAPAYRVRRMFVPPRSERAQLLDGGVPEIARRILEIAQERLA